MDYKNSENKKIFNNFNLKFVSNGKLCNDEIYRGNKNGYFMSPDYLVGLEQMGINLTTEAIEKQLLEIVNENEANNKNKICKRIPVVELMVHPGYPQ